MTWCVTPGAFSDSSMQHKAEWLAQVLNASVTTAEKIGVSPEAIAAQAALESNWGRSRQGQNGLFGVKAGPNWAGMRVACPTREYVNGQYVYQTDDFRDYPTLQACLEDHFAFLTRNSRYKDAGVFDKKGDEHYFYALKAAGYATDPNYAASLIAVENTITSYFQPKMSNGDAPTNPVPPRLLMIGMRGGDVIEVQSVLKVLGFYKASLDGDFGPKTYQGVEEFQSARHLSVDGVVGPQTRAALNLN